MATADKTPSPEKLRASMLSSKSSSKRPTVMLPAHFRPKFWEESDRRCAVVRAIKARYLQLKQHAGGDASYQRDLLVQRAVFLSVVLETLEVRAAEGGELDLGVYTQGTNALVGLLRILGLEKQIKSVGDLKSYLDQKKQ